MDTAIAQSSHEISAFAAGGNISEAISHCESNTYDNALRWCLLNGVTDYEKEIENLKKEISSLEKEVTASQKTVSAPKSGYYYSGVDGYEEIFTLDALNNLDAASFESLTKDEVGISTTSCGKIVNDSKWYIAFELNKKSAASLATQKKYTVNFLSSDASLEMTFLRSIAASDEGNSIIIMSCSYMPEGFNFTRSQPIDFVQSSKSGLKIPTSALKNDIDSTGVKTSGVYVLDGVTVVFKSVDIIFEKDGSYLVAPPDPGNISYISPTKLSLYDTVITAGNDLYVGKTIK